MIEKKIEGKVEQINRILQNYLPMEEGFQKTVLEAMNYSIRVGGKRLRPMMMKETYQLLGGSSDVIEPFMAAIEMIHTYSLVHDDLPAMDNDEYRRGQKTTHAVYGEAMGILTGDALLNYAFETALKAFSMDEVKDDTEMMRRVACAMTVLAQKAGIFGMVGGQVVDVESEQLDEKKESGSASVVTEETLDFIYRLKTGALMESSMMIGAILAGASEEQIQAVEQIAAKVGMAFQIQDDILDVVGTMEVLGKPIGSDEKNHKSTYLTFVGMEKAQQEVQRLSQEAVSMLESLGGDSQFLRELFLWLIDRNK